MQFSKGGITWSCILDMDGEDFNAALEAAERAAKRK